jgi:hypothetical protein
MFTETADALDTVAEKARPASESFVNPAKALALDLAGSVPLVLGAGDLAGVVARRTAAQLARNARHPAVFGVLPDAAAEVVATFDGPFVRSNEDLFVDDVFDDASAIASPTTLRLLLVRDDEEHQDVDVARVADVVRDTATEGGVRVTELRADPGPDLARLGGLVALTDFASVYLALGLGLDPATSPHVADLKERIR